MIPVTPAAPRAVEASIDYFSAQSAEEALPAASRASSADEALQASSRASSDSGSSIQQLTDDLEEAVDCLLKLVPSLQDPAPQDVYNDSAGNLEMKKDIDLAIGMFPKAPSLLLRRLAFSNWKRRQYLESLKLRSREDKTSRTKTTARRSASDEEYIRSIGFYTTSNIINRPNRIGFSPHHPSYTQGTSSEGPLSVNDSVFSGSDYFGDQSATSVSESDRWTGQRRYDIPKPPMLLRPGSAFECPFCGQEIMFGVQVTSNDDWALHVFMDIEPYQCTFDNCLRADKTFGIQEEWFQHELSNHRLCKVWVCQSCNYEAGEKEDIELHLSTKHKDIISGDNLSTVASLCERYSEKALSEQSCPFCGLSKLPPEGLKLHIADHLEQLSLLSIQNDDRYEENFYARPFDNPISEHKAKFVLLNNFVQEQRGFFWQPTQEQPNDSTAGSNLAFVEDSDDEPLDRGIKSPVVSPENNSHSPRPPMQRRGDSWMTKVNTFLDKQDADQPRPSIWKSKVESFLDNQLAQEDTQSDFKLLNPMGEALGDHAVEAAALSPSLMRPLRPFRSKPPPRDLDFIGREGDLARLHKALLNPGSVCILSAAGGMGKTAAAVEYTYRYEEVYSYIFWISAETAISCADTYTFIAIQFVLDEGDTTSDQDRLITLGREFLEQLDKKWLLVFDNVNKWTDIQEYVPMNLSKTQGSLLVTARTSELINPPKSHLMELGALSLDEGRQMLLLSMQPGLNHKQLRSHPEYKLAGEIASLAERVPLALAHIAGYVQVSGCTLTDFVQLWNERRRSTRVSPQTTNPLILSTDKALETVWNIGLREVTSDARELLNILAFLDSENIQKKLLIGEHKEPSLDFLHSDQAFRFDITYQVLIEQKAVLTLFPDTKG